MLQSNEIDTPKRVLVVDDEDDIRGIVSEVLADEGYEVATAPHGAAALHKSPACSRSPAPGLGGGVRESTR